jgi:transposase InsO family protein
MSQIARNLTDSVEGLLTGKGYLIHDRDPLFTDEFLGTLKDAGLEPAKLPPRSPNLNAHAERFVRSIKESCLERHYHSERNHQGLGNRLIFPDAAAVGIAGVIQRRERLGGRLNYYYRPAA